MAAKVWYKCISFFLILVVSTGIMPESVYAEQSTEGVPTAVSTSEPTAAPMSKAITEPTETPVPGSTASPTRTPSPTRSPFPTRTPIAVSTATSEPDVSPMTDSTTAPGPGVSLIEGPTPNPISGSARISKQSSIVVTGIKCRLTKKNTVKLQWKGIAGIRFYEIYRSVGKKSGYSRIQIVSGKATGYEDRTVKKGKYYYKIIVRQADQNAVSLSKAKAVSVEVSFLEKPIIALKKGADGDIKYIEIILRKYRGSYVVIYARKEKKYIPLKIKKGTISHYKKRYRFRYEATNLTLYFKAYTYEKVNGKRIRSPFSAVKRIKT